MVRHFFLVCISLLVALPAIARSAKTLKDTVWIVSQNGCKVRNPSPQKNETITWSGECKDGFASGNGTLTWYQNGIQTQQYTGTMKRGYPHGEGKYQLQHSSLQGNFVNGELHGSGSYTSFDDSKKIRLHYVGEFKHGDFYGTGTEHIGKTRYVGSWTAGRKNGEGKLYFDSMLVYDGEWKNDQFHGTGKRYFFDGSACVGQFKKNHREGFGIVEWPGGTKFVGEFKNDLYDGEGYLIRNKRILKVGNWRSGAFISTGNYLVIKTRLKKEFGAWALHNKITFE
jgi:hypothetical protein